MFLYLNGLLKNSFNPSRTFLKKISSEPLKFPSIFFLLYVLFVLFLVGIIISLGFIHTISFSRFPFIKSCIHLVNKVFTHPSDTLHRFITSYKFTTFQTKLFSFILSLIIPIFYSISCVIPSTSIIKYIRCWYRTLK